MTASAILYFVAPIPDPNAAVSSQSGGCDDLVRNSPPTTGMSIYRDDGYDVYSQVFVGNGSSWTAYLPPLGDRQQEVFDDILAGHNVLLTGPGGTGKSEILRRVVARLRSEGKRVVVAASTGLAAVQVGGSTIHSVLGTGISPNIATAMKYLTAESLARVKDRLGRVDVLIIDEVSQLTGDYIDLIDYQTRLAREVDPISEDAPAFGGIQVVLIGDFLQLPPVIKFGDEVQRKYAYQARRWKAAGFDKHTHYLRKNYRQLGDGTAAEFRKHLLRIRRGSAPEDTLEFINTRVGAKLPVEPTCFRPTNAEAAKVNEKRLKALPGEVFRSQATVEGHEKWREAVIKNCIAEEILELKVGAPVLLLKNNAEKGYVNGTRGTVESFERGTVQVRIQGDNSDDVIDIERDVWELKDASDEVLASMEQFPIKLAWAITMHKSQGMTLDYASIDPSSVFESGQLYVALSRVRTFEGLRLDAPVFSRHVRAVPSIVEWYQKLLDHERARAGQRQSD